MGKLVKVEPSEMRRAKRSKTNNMLLIEEFMAMDVPCVEYEGFTQKSSRICQQTLTLTVKRFGYHNVQIRQIEGHVYLIRKDLIGKMKF